MKQFLKVFQFFLFLLCFKSNYAQKNDSIICSGKFTYDSLKNGVWLCKNGKQVVKKERYKNGILITYIIFNSKGEIIETRNKKGKVKKYNPCGC